MKLPKTGYGTRRDKWEGVLLVFLVPLIIALIVIALAVLAHLGWNLV